MLYKTLPSLFRGKVFLAYFLFLSLPIFATVEDDALHAVFIQFEMQKEILESEEHYTRAMEEAISLALQEGPADLIVFPEYLGVFASLIPYFDLLDEKKPFEEIWYAIHLQNPEILSINDLFIQNSFSTNAFLDRMWGELARKYEVAILSGSRFAYSMDRQGLVNLSVVYDYKGEVLYKQNKHFLTEFEEDILGLVPGDYKKTEGFRIKNKHIRLTICRDTFLKIWENEFTDGDLWIDIKANGVEFTEDQRELFTRALPSRLVNSDIPYGVTLCLTGNFLNLLWEGESTIIYNNKSHVDYIYHTESVDKEEIFRFIMP